MYSLLRLRYFNKDREIQQATQPNHPKWSDNSSGLDVSFWVVPPGRPEGGLTPHFLVSKLCSSIVCPALVFILANVVAELRVHQWLSIIKATVFEILAPKKLFVHPILQ